MKKLCLVGALNGQKQMQITLFGKCCRIVLALSVLTICSERKVFGQGRNDGAFETFQKFVNGELLIREAVVYRRISQVNGPIINQEWWRFGFQPNTWYVQRLEPDKSDASKLVPLANDVIVGASSTHFWTVSQKDVHVAEKALAQGSKPDTFGEFPRTLMFSALSLGIPRNVKVLSIADAPIEWDEMKFRTTASGFGTNTASREIEGQMNLADDRTPISADFAAVQGRPQSQVMYEYRTNIVGVPSVFTLKTPERDYRYEFVSLELGKDPLLAQTNDYTPSVFADLRFERKITVWTNEFPYSLIRGKLQPAFGLAEQSRGGVLAILISMAVGSAIILALWYQRSRRNDKQQKTMEKV